MSPENQAATQPKEAPNFWAKHHDVVPIFIIALMAFSFLFYWKAAPAHGTHVWQHPSAWGRFEWGKYFLMPLSNFLLFMYLLLAQILPALVTMLGERHAHVANSLQSFNERSDEIAMRYREVKMKLEHLDDETEQITKRATERAKAEKEKSIERAKTQAERIKAEADALGSQEVRRVQQELQTELIEKAFSHAQQLITEKITVDDQNRINTDYLQQVGKLS